MIRPVSPSLSPNLQARDILLALKLFFSPWYYFSNRGVKLLELWFRNYFKVSHAISFNSGRSALFSILKSLSVGQGDEVLIQAFTCVAVPNSIIWTGARPVYVDIDESLTMDIKDLEKKITKKTKVIIAQHTFGIPAKIDEIVNLAKKNGIMIIEDCAHTIGAKYRNKKLGSFGDAAFFSFGRDKAFSSVFGGMIITNNQKIGKLLRKIQREENNSSFLWTLQQLFHPICFALLLPLYDFFSIGKIMLVFFQKIKFLSLAVTGEEKLGSAKPFVKRMPNQLCLLALEQLKRIDAFNNRRVSVANFYIEEFRKSNFEIPYSSATPFLRFPLLCEKREELILNLKKEHIYLDKWYSNVIDPKGINYKKIFYNPDSCPRAEFIADRIINLPTNPTMKIENVQELVFSIRKYV